MTVRHQGRRKPQRMLLLAVIAAFSTAAAYAGDHPAQAQVMGAAVQAAASTTAPNPDCTLIVPPNPLSASGLATPYQLVATDPAGGPCNENNTAQSAFVQGAVFDPATGAVSIYNPLVIDKGAKPAAAPVVPTLPANAIVALWFGFNGNNLTLKATDPATLSDAHCHNGLSGSIFGQFSYCNAHAFFKAANAAIASGQLQVPALGTANDGQTCPTVRDFFVVEQDQSDNVTTTYLVTTNGQLAQYSAKNVAALQGAVTIGNGSDNRLLDVFMDGALACKPFMAPDLANPGQNVPALPLNELQARVHQATPVATVPAGDPMTLMDGNENLHKANLYRKGVDQPVADSFHDVSTHRYCRQLIRIQPARLLKNKTSFSKFYSPDKGAANSLYTFLAQRFVATYEQQLNCPNLINIPDPVAVTTSNNVAVSATINTNALNKAIQQLAATKAEDDQKDSSARSQQATE